MKTIALEKENSEKITAYTLLLLTGLGWGMSTVIGKACVEEISPGQILMSRAAVAALMIFLAAPRKILSMGKEELKTGLLLGIFIAGGYYFGILSLKYTTASKAGFLMALNVLLVPVIETFFKRRLPSRWIITSVFLSLAGLKLISGMNGGSFNFGDLLAGICALLYSVYIIQLDRFGKNKDAYVLSFLQVVVLCLTGLAAVLFGGDFDFAPVRNNIIPILILGVFGTGAATLFQTKAQKTASSESVSIILLSDPLFSLVLAVIFLHETVLFSGLVGSGLIICSLLLAIVKKV